MWLIKTTCTGVHLYKKQKTKKKQQQQNQNKTLPEQQYSF